MFANNKLICYYSDETDPAHSQKLVHKTSFDGVHWSPAVDDVALTDPGLPPGMAVVAKMANSKHVYTYEDPPRNKACFKISDDPRVVESRRRGHSLGARRLSLRCRDAERYGRRERQRKSADLREPTQRNERMVDSGHADPRLQQGARPLQGGGLFMVVAGDWGGTRNDVTYGEIAVP